MREFIEITDFRDAELDVFARLTEAQLLNRFEPKKGMFIAESPKVIQRALAAGCRPEKLLVERSHCNEEAMAAIAACGDVPVYTAPLPVLTGGCCAPCTARPCGSRRRCCKMPGGWRCWRT